jgi:hypothetical protein
MSTTRHSPAPWSYQYSPYTVRNTGADATSSVGDELPAFEVFDADGTKVFDSNEDLPANLQEANACLASAAPRMLAALEKLVPLFCELLDDLEDSDDRDSHPLIVEARSAIAQATGRTA